MKITLTEVERQILLNQLDILKHTDPDNIDSYEKQEIILLKGLEYLYDSVVNVRETVGWSIGDETRDILQMHRLLASQIDTVGYSHFTKEEIEAASFDGFDQQEVTGHYDYADYMINIEGKWPEHHGKGLDNHGSRSIGRSLTMLKRFLSHGEKRYQLDVKSIKAIVAY